jgi:hypothetical protein
LLALARSSTAATQRHEQGRGCQKRPDRHDGHRMGRREELSHPASQVRSQTLHGEHPRGGEREDLA